MKKRTNKDSKFFETVGVITSEIASRIGREWGVVAIDEIGKQHIELSHPKELDKIGMSAIDYVRFVGENFNEIRKGQGRSLVLVVNRYEIDRCAIIKLKAVCNQKFNQYYLIMTALPIRRSYLEKLDLLWTKSAP